MRLLNFGDIFAGARLLKMLEARETIKKYAAAYDGDNDENGDALWESGFNLVWELLESVSDEKSERAICEFLARPFEMTPEDVSALPLGQLPDMLTQLARENDLRSFFAKAQKQMR